MKNQLIRVIFHYFTLDQAERFLDSLTRDFTIEHPEVIRKNGRKIPAYTETVTTPFQYVPFFTLAIYGGFRRSEILALTWKDIDFKNRTVSITKAVTKTKEEDKLPLIHLHDLRHTQATLLLANGVDVETVSHRLGHSKPSITLDVYGHWMKETDKTASDTLENLFKNSKVI